MNALCPPRAAVETAVRTAPRPPAGISGQNRFSTNHPERIERGLGLRREQATSVRARGGLGRWG